MKIVSYNLNGIRAAFRNGIKDWIRAFDADIYCFQETRANETQCRELVGEFTEYYAVINSGERAGYSGTLVLSKTKPNKIDFSLAGENENEGRIITLFFDNFTLLNVYVPNGGTRLEYKLEFTAKLENYAVSLAKETNVIICADMNTGRSELDVSHPKIAATRTGYLPIEREVFEQFLARGFVDSFRELNLDKRQYSWRSYQSRYYGQSFGWKYRFDYILINKNLKSSLKKAYIEDDLPYSDHLPVVVEILF